MAMKTSTAGMIRTQAAQAAARGGLARAAHAVVAAGAVLSSAGCSSLPDAVNPVAWYHHIQGGAIDQPRPPAPGANQPYPDLASVPDKPVPTDPKLRAQIADALIADRTNAQYVASQQPIPDPSSPQASPQLFGQGTARPPAPPGANGINASLSAANAPPRAPIPAGPPAPGTAAPSRAATSAAPPLPAASPPAAPGASAPGATKTVPMPAQTASAATPLDVPSAQRDAAPVAPEAELPPLPAAPPPSPALPGAPAARPIPAAVPHPPAPPPAAPSQPGPPVAVGFQPGSTSLGAEATATLKALAAKRGEGTVMVVGYGEATTNDPQAQSAALKLALARANAVASVLATAGVPADHIEIDAEAGGRGAAARVVN